MSEPTTPLRQGSGAHPLSPHELAASAGVSTDTLRHYERSGVLPRPARTRAGYRRYPADAVARLALVRRALAIGFSIKELALVFREREQGGAPCRRVRGIVGNRLARIDDEMAALATLKSELTALLKEWDAKLSSTPSHEPAKLLDSLILSPQDTCTRK